MRITAVKISPTDEGNLLGYAEITIDRCFRIQDLQIFRRPRGYYVAMPQVRQEDGTYREVAFALNAQTQRMIKRAIIAEYKKVTGNPVRKARN